MDNQQKWQEQQTEQTQQEQQNQQDRATEQEEQKYKAPKQEQQKRQHNLKLPTKFHFKKMRLWLSSKFSASSALRTMALLAIVLWAYREGLFDQVPGIKNLVDVGLNIGNEVCGFFADLLTKLYEILHIETIWHFIRSIVQ